MDAKTEAQRRRHIANLFDEIAEHRAAIGDISEGARSVASGERERADKLDPPPPEWQDGDLVRDRQGELSQYRGGRWRSIYGPTHSTEELTNRYGPLTRVLTYDPATQRVADPAKQEVVVSLDGIDRGRLDAWAGYTELSLPEAVARRAAKAAREQLSEVQ